jgi:2-C-methyl-D-erythritol 4-phosphate cytidylyltransferase
MNSVIIAAAGSGTRFGSDIPKQFHTLGGKPLIAHTISRFEECGSIDEIVIVCSSDQINSLGKIVIEHSFTKVKSVVAGGNTRAESVKNGFAAMNKDTVIVAVHDGVRPFVTPKEIDAVVAKADETGAACLVGLVIDTIKEVDGEMIVRTIDRKSLRRALTPQTFRYSILREALSGDLGEDITDECSLVERLGLPIAFIEGSSRNIKITTADDILIAESFLADQAR